MGIEWILSALAVTIASLGIVMSLYLRAKTAMGNDLKHIHKRIDEVQEDVADLRERSSAVERDVAWLKAKS